MKDFSFPTFGRLPIAHLFECLLSELRGLRLISESIESDILHGAVNCRLRFAKPDDVGFSVPRICTEDTGGRMEPRGCRFPDDHVKYDRSFGSGVNYDNRLSRSMRSIAELTRPFQDDPTLAPGVRAGFFDLCQQSRYAWRWIYESGVSEFRDMHCTVWTPPSPIPRSEFASEKEYLEMIVLPVSIYLVDQTIAAVQDGMSPHGAARKTSPSRSSRKSPKRGRGRPKKTKPNKVDLVVASMLDNGDVDRYGRRWKDLVIRYGDRLPRAMQPDTLRKRVEREEKRRLTADIK